MKSIGNDKKPNHLISHQLIRRIHEIIDNRPSKITPLALKKLLRSESRYSGKEIKSAINLLIAEGSLMYTNYFGATYIEKSIFEPIGLSEHVILKLPKVHYDPNDNEVIINLMPGAAFGMGDHPSTRLAISAMDHILWNRRSEFMENNSIMLDIGTGSGILAITALKLGLRKAVGIDIDPCAVIEAKQNAGINGLAHRFSVLESSLDGVYENYDLITANLRYPTLINIFYKILYRLNDGGIIIMSGIKTDEMAPVRNVYTKTRLKDIWSGNEKGWSGLALQETG